jgi:hypothetical protein
MYSVVHRLVTCGMFNFVVTQQLLSWPDDVRQWPVLITFFQLPALATEVYLGDPTRFADGKARHCPAVGMIPEEDSSGKRRVWAVNQTRQGDAALSVVRSGGPCSA